MHSLAESWLRRELSFEQLIDHHYQSLYALRNRVRATTDTLAMIPGLATDIVRTWISEGRSLAACLHNLLATHRTKDGLPGVVGPGDAVRLIESAIQHRADELGPSIMDAFVQLIFVQVVDAKWRQHLSRMRVLREQRNGLYEPASMIEARAADAIALFAACEQQIRADTIRYALELSPSVSWD